MSNPLGIIMVNGNYNRLDDIVKLALASAWYRWDAGTEISLSHVKDIARAWQTSNMSDMSDTEKAIVGLRATDAKFESEIGACASSGLIQTDRKDIEATIDNAIGLVIVNVKDETFTFDTYACQDTDEYRSERYEDEPDVEELARFDGFGDAHKVEEAEALLDTIEQNPDGIRIGDEVATWLS